MNSLKQQLLRYWLAMNASAFDAASHASMTFVAASGGHELSPGIAPFDLKQFALIFGMAFVGGLRAYLKAHPIDNLLAPVLPAVLRVQDAVEKANAEIAEAGAKAPANGGNP
ncbi:MAG TPA: hypothetical protein VGY56_10620 [Verrucomicrobiae bacterium]|nr:hypothetical protein [Verrucomicrobiae bacterium]